VSPSATPPSERRVPAARRRRGLALASAAIVAALVLAGCSAETSGDSAASTTSCKTVTKVNVMYSTTVLDVSYVPYGMLAKELGYYKAMCIDPTFSINGTSITTEQALISGKADVGMVSPDDLIQAAETKALPIKVFTNLIPKLIYNVAVPTDSPITSYADLKGKTIGVPLTSALFNAYLQARLKPEGLKLDDVKQVATGFGSAPMASMKSGAIDGFLAWPGLWASYRNAGYKFVLLPEASWQNDYYSIGLGTTNAYAKANPDVLKKITKGIVMTNKYLQKKGNLEKAVRLYWADYPTSAPLPGDDEAKALKKDEAVLTATIQEMDIDTRPASYDTWGAQDLATWKRQVAFDKAGGLITKTLDPSQFFTDEYTAQANK
jgi:NitT/TauT family transport system substrate-binding protein